jgi:hypothetical protein
MNHLEHPLLSQYPFYLDVAFSLGYPTIRPFFPPIYRGTDIYQLMEQVLEAGLDYPAHSRPDMPFLGEPHPDYEINLWHAAGFQKRKPFKTIWLPRRQFINHLRRELAHLKLKALRRSLLGTKPNSKNPHANHNPTP